MDNQHIIAWMQALQDDICQAIEAADGGGRFAEDRWERTGGGGGRTRILQGKVIEKGGVNFSAVHGALPTAVGKGLGIATDCDFLATGVSIVMHPHSPMVPIIHMNVRYFELSDGSWWFGGGIDLTPHYIVPADAQYFHQALREVCNRHNPYYYLRFKAWADDYFYLKHRDETRGIGGIFFDRLSETDSIDKAARWAFVQDVGKAFAPIYTYFMQRNKTLPYTDAHKQWQLLRRGRYVEFNLVWDKGTKFGLDTDGRTESILMSLPATASWAYNHTPTPNSPEAFTLAHLRKGVDWLDERG